ncbi:MAG: hypothetical protein OSJ37_03325 [Muribaculaceae bacterium]|nr:hypothetical protein [Muribaculaceae bacterium]
MNNQKQTSGCAVVYMTREISADAIAGPYNITNTDYVINYGYPMPRFTACGGVKPTL